MKDRIFLRIVSLSLMTCVNNFANSGISSKYSGDLLFRLICQLNENGLKRKLNDDIFADHQAHLNDARVLHWDAI